MAALHRRLRVREQPAAGDGPLKVEIMRTIGAQVYCLRVNDGNRYSVPAHSLGKGLLIVHVTGERFVEDRKVIIW
jgi:hypothetical protein